MNTIPETGFLRLPQIIGDPGDPEEDPPKPPTPALIPVKKSTWWKGVKEGRYPKGVKISKRCTAWRIEDILKLIEGVK